MIFLIIKWQRLLLFLVYLYHAGTPIDVAAPPASMAPAPSVHAEPVPLQSIQYAKVTSGMLYSFYNFFFFRFVFII